MIDIQDGLFICNKLNHYQTECCKKYCKIIAASIYSVNNKTIKSVIAYKIAFWNTLPITTEDFSNFTIFRSDRHGSIIHTFEAERKKYTRDELLYLCEKHFLETSLFNYTPKVLTDEVDRLSKIENRYFRKSKLLSDKVVGVWNILHKTKYESTDGNIPILMDNVLKYRGDFLSGQDKVYNFNFGDNYLSFNVDWEDNLSKLALENLDKQETLDYCIANFLGT